MLHVLTSWLVCISLPPGLTVCLWRKVWKALNGGIGACPLFSCRAACARLVCQRLADIASLHNLMYRVQYRRLRVNDSAQTAQPQTYSPINLPSRLYRLESLCCSLGICGIIGFVILCHSLGLSKESNPLVCARYVRARSLKP